MASQWQPTPVLLPGKSHGQRSLVGCSPWGHKESDTTERLHFHFSLSCTGEGNGNPLQCSCLENPRDGGVWWAAVYGVEQSRTWLKRLSSSSSSIHLHNIMWHITEPSSLKLCCSLYFLLIQSWQLRAFSSHSGHAHRPKNAHWFPGIYHSFTDSSFPKFSFYSFWSTNCLPQLLPTAWGWCNVQHLPMIVFNKCPQG